PWIFTLPSLFLIELFLYSLWGSIYPLFIYTPDSVYPTLFQTTSKKTGICDEIPVTDDFQFE
ncbi:hypothetical protein MKC48_19930, partial [[Clostridium] innocuum]|nr:hypothetical protein [[Clostridium] innocuum]